MADSGTQPQAGPPHTSSTPLGVLAAAVQEVAGQTVVLGFVDQGYTSEAPATAVAAHGITLEVITLPKAKRASCCCRGAGSSSAPSRGPRSRRLAEDYERLPETVAGLHFVAFACLMLHRLVTLAAQSP